MREIERAIYQKLHINIIVTQSYFHFYQIKMAELELLRKLGPGFSIHGSGDRTEVER